MQMAVDLKIFDILAEKNGSAVTTAELAKQTGAEDALIGQYFPAPWALRQTDD